MTMIASPENGTALAVKPLIIEDNSQFANLLDTGRFGHLQRVATLFAGSELVPAHFQNKVSNCFIALQMALRLGVDPFMFMQNTYIVHGRPGMEAKLAIALINSSGLFESSLDYQVHGDDDPFATAYRVRAFATRKGAKAATIGPWIDWKLVKAERWDSKDGSKWKTMPGMMFQYRAATFFGRLHCPERLMGMQTQDELEDAAGTQVVETPTKPFSRTQALARKFGAEKPTTAADMPITSVDPIETVNISTGEVQSETTPDHQAEKEQQEQPLGDENQTAVADYSDITTWAAFVSAMESRAQRDGISSEQCGKTLGAIAIRKGWKGANEKKADPKFLQEILVVVDAKKFDWVKGWNQD